jgi:threonine/homoserine/homoserine lactone efflux protein
LLDILPSLLAFSLAMALTPGPNNVMVTASAATFGFRRTVPHMLGITVGFPAMTVAVGLGLGTVFTTYPVIHVVLKWVGAAYLCWLAWLVATASRPEAGEAGAGPFGFWRAALFQWVNPKAWLTVFGALATYTTVEAPMGPQVAFITAVFVVLTFPCLSVWALFGTVIGRFLSTGRCLRIFNVCMAALVLASLVPALR